MKKILYCLCLLSLTNILFASLPIMHVHLAEKWMQEYTDYTEEEQQEFILGTLFPDIRYITQCPRDETHEHNVKLEDIISCQSPFQAGKKLHCFVDDFRESIVAKHDLYELFADIPHPSTFIKLLEDEYVYDLVDIQKLHVQLQTISQEEIDFGIDQETIAKWHEFLRRYSSGRPSVQLKLLCQTQQSFFHVSPEDLKIWQEHFPDAFEKTHDYIHEFINSFEEL